jgi:phosphoribosyl 1,2-cyclic phosphate phosphodiesterase
MPVLKRKGEELFMRIRFLGTGTSHGIPVIGCKCPVCRSNDPKDRRSRTAVLIEQDGLTLLVDAPPELRLQLLAAKVSHADAMLITHAHADHISGLDDVRVFSERENQDFSLYGSASSLGSIRRRFDYVFRKTQKGGGKPRLALHAVNAPFRINRLKITPVPVWHGRLRVFGYRIGDFAYLTDVSEIPESSYALLQGLSVLVLPALRPEPHETHFHVERALAEAARIKADRTYFTHMCHRLGHAATNKTLPKNVRLAYDGLELKL